MRAYRRRYLSGLALALLLALAGCAQSATGPAPPRPPLPGWAWEMPHCAAYRPDAYAAPGHRLSVSITTAGRVTEVYEPGWGAQAMAEIRKLLRACGSFEYGGTGDPAAYLAQHAVVDSGFAGEESLLVETVRLQPPEPVRTSYAAVVRTGDVVVTWRPAGADAATVRCLARAEPAGPAPAGPEGVATCPPPRA